MRVLVGNFVAIPCSHNIYRADISVTEMSKAISHHVVCHAYQGMVNVRSASPVTKFYSCVPCLVPILQAAIQTTRNYFTRLPWMPRNCRRSSFASRDLVIHLAGFPVPKAHISSTIPGSDHAAIRRDCNIDGVAGGVVATKSFLCGC